MTPVPEALILCVTLNPVFDSLMFIDEFRPVYRTDARRITYQAGGKGTNVARALGTLGVPARAFTTLGGGVGRLVAESLRAEMASETMPPAIAWVSGETRLQVTLIDALGEQRSYYAPPASFTAEDGDAVRQEFSLALASAAAVCLCGSSPAPLADGLFPEMLRLAAQRGLPTLLDSYGPGLMEGMAAKPTVLKMNQAEAEGLLGRPLDSDADRNQALLELGAAGSQVILTLGAEGALFAAQGRRWRAHPPAVKVVNPIGSGDAFTAGYMAAMSRGSQPVACFRLGMAAAVANTLTWQACHFAAADVVSLAAAISLEPID
jgi:1-phosphofructokinase family hexose kinase